jgi:hypothetical protein
MGAGNPRITVSVSDWRRKMHCARGRQAYVEGNGARRKAGARKPRWGSTAETVIEYFKDRCTTLDMIRQNEFYKENLESIRKIAHGGNLWVNNDLKEFEPFSLPTD